MEQLINDISSKARIAESSLQKLSTDTKNLLIEISARNIKTNISKILSANAKDIELATNKKRGEAYIDRLMLDQERVKAMIDALNAIVKLPDPVGKELASWTRPNGLNIRRVATPLGVIGVIFESRPNVASDVSGLCIKSGNAVVLRSGSDSLHSSMAIVDCFKDAFKELNLPEGIVQIIPTTNREMVTEMLLGLNSSIDVIVPRGGKNLVSEVQKSAKIPVFGHLEGICHAYIDKDADPKTALEVTLNSKMRRPGICGALETLLIHKDASNQLHHIIDALKNQGCEIRGCRKTISICRDILTADESDWDTEYLSPILSIKVVENIHEAIAHIQTHGTGHTETIISENKAAQNEFTESLDSAIVMINTSTQFADGGEFGLGGEIGIATGKFHARGPVGLEQLTSYKYIVDSNGALRN
ncbi:MAG: glutamate-5-semialdehyde dehydrogenase [Gammaproteobacteria bacterium]